MILFVPTFRRKKHSSKKDILVTFRILFTKHTCINKNLIFAIITTFQRCFVFIYKLQIAPKKSFPLGSSNKIYPPTYRREPIQSPGPHLSVKVVFYMDYTKKDPRKQNKSITYIVSHQFIQLSCTRFFNLQFVSLNRSYFEQKSVCFASVC